MAPPGPQVAPPLATHINYINPLALGSQKHTNISLKTFTTYQNMNFNKNRPILLSILFGLYFTFTNGATFNVVNQCGYTVWAAAKPGGGMQLGQGQTWTFDVAPRTTSARVWGRTNCNFDASGRGQCSMATHQIP